MHCVYSDKALWRFRPRCLTCSKDNGAALHIYAAMGFCPTGAADEDEIELVLNLT